MKRMVSPVTSVDGGRSTDVPRGLTSSGGRPGGADIFPSGVLLAGVHGLDTAHHRIMFVQVIPCVPAMCRFDRPGNPDTQPVCNLRCSRLMGGGQLVGMKY